MSSVPIARYKTALRRTNLSRPIRLALAEGLINESTSVFDYGCGHGDDIQRLFNLGIRCAGWDSFLRSNVEKHPADIVNLGYVINVIEDSNERLSTLREAWRLSQKLLIVSARLNGEGKDENLVPYRDGYLTRTGTFQKYYEQHELRDWINSSLDVASIPAAPGIFYVFRDDDLKQTFIASRYKRRIVLPRQRRHDILFETHKALLEPLIEFVAYRGRLPDNSEIVSAPQICSEFGSLKLAFRLVRQVTGSDHWGKIREERLQDMLVYIALSRFSGRPRFSSLPRDFQFDIRAFFSTYKRACALADDLLFSLGDLEVIASAMRTSAVGKLTPKALYIHTSALTHLPSVLRIYEGCARAYLGAVEEANIVKLYRDTPQVSYLSYPDFESDPHPALAASVTVHLKTFRTHYREYIDAKNPPIIHRKEEFVAADHPSRPKFTQLTRQEERWQLYETPELIGTRNGWQEVLNQKGVYVSGHRVLRMRTKEGS
jgi:DNA phosphorothioation-associated putative methyltransferase